MRSEPELQWLIGKEVWQRPAKKYRRKVHFPTREACLLRLSTGRGCDPWKHRNRESWNPLCCCVQHPSWFDHSCWVQLVNECHSPRLGVMIHPYDGGQPDKALLDGIKLELGLGVITEGLPSLYAWESIPILFYRPSDFHGGQAAMAIDLPWRSKPDFAIGRAKWEERKNQK